MKSIDDYLVAWNANTSESRHHLLVNSMTADVLYIDPYVPIPIEGIQSLIERRRKRFDHQLKPVGKVNTHHRVFVCSSVCSAILVRCRLRDQWSSI